MPPKCSAAPDPSLPSGAHAAAFPERKDRPSSRSGDRVVTRSRLRRCRRRGRRVRALTLFFDQPRPRHAADAVGERGMSATLPVRIIWQDAWDEFSFDFPATTSLADVKRRALDAARVLRDPQGYLLKFRGAELRDESRSLAEAGLAQRCADRPPPAAPAGSIGRRGAAGASSPTPTASATIPVPIIQRHPRGSPCCSTAPGPTAVSRCASRTVTPPSARRLFEQNGEPRGRLGMIGTGIVPKTIGMREDERRHLPAYRTGRRRRGRTISAPLGTRPASASERDSSRSSAPRNLSR